MNEKILISYIIPAYNAADTLERAVESITHTCNMEKCEILIVENGSTDYTNSVALKLIQKYGENVKLIHSEKGVSRARNEGLKNARGEWIVFVDADDYIVSKSKKYIYEDILNAKADLYVYSYEIGNRANYINNKEEKTYYFNDSAEKMKLEMIANPTKFMQVWGKIFRKSIIYENRIGFNTKMQLSEDSDFTLHYLMHCSRISISDTIFYHYSIDNESTMRSNADKKVLQYIEAMNITSKYIEKQHENVQLAFNDYILMHLNIACVRGIFCVNNKENYVKKIEHAIDVEKYCFDDVKRKKLRRDLKWEENYIIGNIGRLHFQKNQMFILDIFEKLIKKEPKVRLILIGDGEDRTKLEKEIDKKKLNKYVYMAGIQKDICGWLSTFDLFLFPSKFEGLSMAAMEAQANGVPMLASDSVIPKEVKINPSFIFWNLENSAESWAEEILNIKENINRVSQKEIVDNFTMRGYEIHTEAKKLEKLLLNGVVNK